MSVEWLCLVDKSDAIQKIRALAQSTGWKFEPPYLTTTGKDGRHELALISAQPLTDKVDLPPELRQLAPDAEQLITVLVATRDKREAAELAFLVNALIYQMDGAMYNGTRAQRGVDI